MTRLIEALAEFDDRIAPGWPGDGYRAARTVAQVTVGAVCVIVAMYLLVLYGVAFLG